MKLLLSRVSLLLLLLVSTTFASVVLEAEGSGIDVKSAKKEALAQLSALIEVKIDTTSSSQLKSESINGKERSSKKVEQRAEISSKSYLVGVEYEKIEETSSSVKYRAILSDDALRKSIQVLYDAISQDVEVLELEEMQKVLKKSEYLLVLINFNSNVVNKSDVLAKREYLYNAIHKSRIIIDVLPKDAKIYIDAKEYANGKTHFFAAGKHTLEVKKSGYITEKRTLYTQVAKMKNIELSLIKKSALPATIRVKGATAFRADIRRELLKYDIEVSSSAKESLEFSSERQYVTTIAGVKIYNLFVVADWKEGDTLLESKKATLKSVAQSQIEKKELALIKALIKSQVKAYAKK